MPERVALVTGGSRGIGRAACLELARTGHAVAINCRNGVEEAKETLSLVQETGHDGVVVQADKRRIDIAEHWMKTHPYRAPALRPSRMGREEFVERFGGIFEHSAWIAERAYELELGPAHDSAGGLHNALARIFRSASEEERLGVLKAHPDLAGKLAQAKRLTPESTAEQASAGLDALTDGAFSIGRYVTQTAPSAAGDGLDGDEVDDRARRLADIGRVDAQQPPRSRCRPQSDGDPVPQPPDRFRGRCGCGAQERTLVHWGVEVGGCG